MCLFLYSIFFADLSDYRKPELASSTSPILQILLTIFLHTGPAAYMLIRSSFWLPPRSHDNYSGFIGKRLPTGLLRVGCPAH